MFFLTALEFFNVFVIHVKRHISHNLLPLCKSSKFVITVNTHDSPFQKLLPKFEPLNKHNPRVPHISLAYLLPLSLKPFTLFINECFALLCSTLIPELDEVVASSVSEHCFCCDEDTSFQIIHPLSTSNPSVVASSQHLSVEHVPHSLKLLNLLSSRSQLLLPLNLLFCIQLIDQILVFVHVVFSNL
jgi:hypothetical protein